MILQAMHNLSFFFIFFNDFPFVFMAVHVDAEGLFSKF